MDAALAGGADIVDAKDPARGALGAMEPDRLARVLDRVPGSVPFSAALGDPADAAAAATLIERLPLRARAAPTYVKLGVAAVGSARAAERMLRAGVEAAGRKPGRPLLIAVAYADAAPHGLGPERIAELAWRAGASGVLVDTMLKETGSLLDSFPVARLRTWVTDARGLGLLVALAGRLDRPELQKVASAGADVVGVRGAACEGGREGRVSTPLVRRLRDALTGVAEERDRAAKH